MTQQTVSRQKFLNEQHCKSYDVRGPNRANLDPRKAVFILDRATIVDGVLKRYTVQLMTGQKGPVTTH